MVGTEFIYMLSYIHNVNGTLFKLKITSEVQIAQSSSEQANRWVTDFAHRCKSKQIGGL